MIFGSRSVAAHLLRGLVGAGAFAAALRLGVTPGAPAGVAGWPALVASLALLGVALWAFRGCPVCWTIGLAESVAHRRAQKRAPGRGGSPADPAMVAMVAGAP